jgi:hypothetical protein
MVTVGKENEWAKERSAWRGKACYYQVCIKRASNGGNGRKWIFFSFFSFQNSTFGLQVSIK